MDSTNSTFDNKVVTEYLDGTTRNPLVVGANPNARSDGRIFGLNNRQTISAMSDPNVYSGTCSGIFAKMINSVPRGTPLSDVIAPYDIKPSNLQLNVAADGQNLDFTGELRIHHTSSLQPSSISSIQLIYKDRTGTSNNAYTISATAAGDANGFDDTFTVSVTNSISTRTQTNQPTPSSTASPAKSPPQPPSPPSPSSSPSPQAGPKPSTTTAKATPSPTRSSPKHPTPPSPAPTTQETNNSLSSPPCAQAKSPNQLPCLWN